MPDWIDLAGEWLQQALPYVVGGLVVLLLFSWIDRHRSERGTDRGHDGDETDAGGGGADDAGADDGNGDA